MTLLVAGGRAAEPSGPFGGTAMGVLERLAQAVRRVFRAQRLQADGGKTRFGDWNARLAKELEPTLEGLYAAEARKSGLDRDRVEGAGRQRALLTARGINDTTRQWLEEGRDAGAVFSAERAARVAVTEASFARHDALMFAAKSRGSELVWRTGGRRPCPRCRSLNGRRVAAGKRFVARDGSAAAVPPLHPYCMCKVEEVRRGR